MYFGQTIDAVHKLCNRQNGSQDKDKQVLTMAVLSTEITINQRLSLHMTSLHADDQRSTGYLKWTMVFTIVTCHVFCYPVDRLFSFRLTLLLV